MDIISEKAKILNIYEEISSGGLFKIASTKDKILVYILPYILVPILSFSFLYGTLKNIIVLNVLNPIFLFIFFYYTDKIYKNYRRKTFYLPNGENKDTHYNLFVDNLVKHKIELKDIEFYIDLLIFDKDSSTKDKSGFFDYLFVIYIPGLMIYYSKILEKLETIIYLSFGLFIIPLFIFLFKNIFNAKKNKFVFILQYLKRRKIELNYEK
jgi:hypothetical protein